MQTVKSIGIAIALVLSFYILSPTLFHLSDAKQTFAAQNKPLPWYYKIMPEAEINLGLDLRGGTYIDMEVDLDDALDHQINSILSDVRHNVFRDELEKLAAERVGKNIIRVEVAASQFNALQASLVRIFGPKQFNTVTAQKEIFFDVVGDADVARKRVTESLKNKDLVFLNDHKAFGLAYDSEAEKQELVTLMSAPELAAVAKPKTAADVIYLEVTTDHVEKIKKDIIDQAAKSVRNRIDRFGVSEASVSRQGQDRLVIELPGTKNPDDIINVIKTTGKLEFRIVDDSVPTQKIAELVKKKSEELKLTTPYEEASLKMLNAALKSELPENSEIAFTLDRDRATKKITRFTPLLISKTAEVTGDMLENVNVQSSEGVPDVSMTFTKLGAQKFGDVTSKNIRKQLAIVLDNVVMSAPVIQSAILGGQAQITLGRGNYQDLYKEAQDLSLILKEGALPASLKVGSKNIVGPSLGQDSIDAGLRSIFVSGAAVVIFMLLYYRVGGLIANIALFFNVVFIFAILTLLGASLTLPGMAGIVLTMGMAVDANVLIFERMREERRQRSDVVAIVDSAYKHALTAIIDGNVATFIAGVFLFQYGTGPIKGFATTLMIGIATTLLTAVVVSRTIYDFCLKRFNMKSVGF